MSKLNRNLAMLLATTCFAWWGGDVQAAVQPAPNAPLVWPRTFDAASERLEIYEPQIESWDGNRMAGRAAIAVGPAGGAPTYGVARFSAIADVDKQSGLVHLSHIEISGVDVPTDPGDAARIRSVMLARLPVSGLTTSLDELQTSYAASVQRAATQRVAVQNNAPHIVFAPVPTVLVMVDGQPAWRAIGGSSYQRALNARALLLRDPAGSLYLRASGYWYETASSDGKWRLVSAPAQRLLDAAKHTEAVEKADPLLPAAGTRPARAPAVLMATEPTELIVTDGPPRLTPVAGVGLLSVSNTDHAVFVDPNTNQYFVLVSGRWFSGPGEGGPWRYVPGTRLPADFARIPPNDPKANVLASVPGTPQAKEAAIAATIPQTASVSRDAAAPDITYDGPPRFSPIAGTSLSYALNTATPVIETDPAHYYAVVNGVWFVATSPAGRWRVATQVPDAIYNIPASAPLHYVVYVRLYSVTPDTVVMGYTPGYMGVVVNADGTVVYGTGYVYPPYVGAVYYGYPPTYGYGAGFAVSAAEGFAFGFAAGAIWGAAEPYWGPYRGGGWNSVNVNQANFYGRWGEGAVTHATGWNAWSGTQWRGTAASGFNPATGAHDEGGRGTAFNPYSGNYAAGRQRSFSNPSTGMAGGARGGFAGNEYNGNYAGGRQAAGYNAQTGRGGAAEFGVAGNAQTGQQSITSKGFVNNRSNGNAVAWNNGDVYAGHDGNVYQHTAGGGWQQHTDGGWQSVQPKADVTSDLEQQRQARDVGRQRFDARAGQWGGAHPSFEGRSGGEAGFGGGGFRRGGLRR